MIQEELEKELLNLPDGAWYELEELVGKEDTFSVTFRLLVRKRLWLQNQIKKEIIKS